MHEVLQNTDERLVRCFSSVFPDLSEQQIRSASIQSVPVWDSLAAVTLIALVQQEFGIEIDLADFPQLTSFEAVRNFIQKRNGNHQTAGVWPKFREYPVKENLIRGFKNRLFQHLARILPGARTLRVRLHRARGVNIGKDVWIGYDVILDTSRPHLITIEDRASLSMRVTVVAHFRETQGVRIEQDAFVGPGTIILPNVVIGRGAVVSAGSVVTKSVPPMTLVQGNPATPVAQCGIALAPGVSVKEFSRRLKPLASEVPVPRREAYK
jgi:acetyltransferase-like isoleucine patch superfamily enzyme